MRVDMGGGGSVAPVVYSDPRARPGSVRLWSAPAGQDDAVSALMSRNRTLSSYVLSEQWRGLGGALLKRFAETGSDYAQTLVDEVASPGDDVIPGMTPEDQARQAAAILARQASELDSVATHAPTAGMTIRTRSGQSVELQIAVSAGLNGILGMKAEIHASGAMSEGERAAVARLAEGLDRVLEGLGQQEAAVLDLSGLVGYDRTVLAGIDVTVDNTQSHQPLGSFALHLGDDKRTVSLKGSDGDMDLSVAAGKPAGLHRGAAMQRMLDRMDGVGERGRANAAAVQQMKAAFQALQSFPGGADAAAEPQAGGLADFEGSLSGDTWRSNPSGTAHEAGRVDYRLSQQTTGAGRSVAQTVSEHLSADFLKAPGGAMLDVDNGNFTATRVRDASTVTTLIDSAAGPTPRVLRKTEADQLKTVTDFRDHRVTHQQSWPVHTRLQERLG